MKNSVVSLEEIKAPVRDLELSGKPLCVHSSLLSFGWVEGGAAAVVEAILDEGCILVPTFTYEFTLPPPPDDHPSRNGSDYSLAHVAARKNSFTSDSQEISREMGAIPAYVVALPNRVRGSHPLDSFSAVGPQAERLIADQTAVDVYAPFRALAELGGVAVLMGVRLDSMTLLHYAEQLAGRELFIRWALDPRNVIRTRVGGCSNGFPNLDRILAPIEAQATVGDSLWRASPVAALLELASREIRRNSSITHCGRQDCERCNDAVAGGPLV